MKILMTTTSLGIGGAETHILELVKALKAKGFDVIIASAGGVYVADIEAAGIRHFTVPMNKRSLPKILKSLHLLRKILKAERPDIVHAHARLPAWLCGLVRKTIKFRLVTTAHFTFDVRHGLKYLTNWGEKTIAVSDDLKEYLHDNYGTDYAQISTTINGINTDLFSPEIDGTSIVREFSLDLSAPIIGHVSRLDEHTSIIADYLIDTAADLDRAIPGVQIVITGGGTCYSRLLAKAENANNALGRRIIIMTGPRTDINQIVVNCTLFVGVSRAALEAMAAEKPVVLAGAQGFMGLFTKDKLEQAISTNLCCRDCPAPTAETMLDCIVKSINALTDTQRALIGAWGRQVVFEYYSVSRMADDYIAVYNKIMTEPQKIVISGYYGFGNCGDEAILQAIHSNLLANKTEISITVLSCNPRDTRTRYGYRAINRFNMISVRRALKKCDLLISGGGSLLQDHTSTRSLLYYLSIIRLAKRYGKKVMIYANGIGPVTKPKNRQRVKEVVSKADVITLRDQSSAEELQAMGVQRDDVRITADPVFTLTSISHDATRNLLLRGGVPVDEPYVCVSIRQWTDIAVFCEKFAVFLDGVIERYGHNIVFVVMQSPQDYEVSLQVQNLMQNKLKTYILRNIYLADELLGVIERAEFVVSMRLHPLIFAGRTATPYMGIIYDPKVESFLKETNMPAAGTVQDFDAETAMAIAIELTENRRQYETALLKRTDELCTAAHTDEQHVIRLLKETE